MSKINEEQPLSDKQVRLMTFVEQKFWETGEVVTNDYIVNFFGDHYVTVHYLKGNHFWKNHRVRKGLIARGVDLTKEFENVLTPNQVMAASVMMNLQDKRSPREKLKGIGVTVGQWDGWLREPQFAKYLKSRAEAMFSHADATFYKSMVQKIEDGDYSWAKMYAEMKGHYTPKLDVSINLNIILVQLIEIIQKYVQDTDVIEAIAEEIEALDLGLPPAVQSQQLTEAITEVARTPEYVERAIPVGHSLEETYGI